MPAKKPRRIRLDWIPLDVAFPRGRKAVALGIATSSPMAWANVVLLWTWAAENARTGVIEGPDAVGVIEHAAGWTGDPGRLVECMSLPHIRLLDQTSSGFAIHDWAEHTGKHLVVAQTNAENNARRQDEYRARNALRNAPVTKNGGPSNGNREGEGEGEESTTQEQGAVAREAGSTARQAIDAMHPGSGHPHLDQTIKALRARGIAPAYPKNGTRASVEAAIREVGVAVAVERIYAAWDTTQPWLTFYLQTIAGRAPTTKSKPAPTTNAAAGIGTQWGGPAPF